jgi:hypothetical protein
MKKILFVLAAVLFTVGSMFATKALSEARVYLNAGHGSWGPNDRPMATIPYPNLANGMPDTCGFYESNTNLWKVLHMAASLEAMGVKPENVMFSRVKNGPYPYVKGAADEELYNRSLSDICYEVNANNMDVFVSIHSNAATEGTSTNYPLYLYRGSDGVGGDSVPTSRDMALSCWPFLWKNQLDPKTYYGENNPNVRGDISFYSSWTTDVRYDTITHKSYAGKLGVLKHGVPGYLCEGYFHTYQPARHRALNSDYCGQEGMRQARGIAAFFGVKQTTGSVMGTVKDLHEKIVNKLFNYNPGTNDQWLPVNGAKVTLYKDGSAVKTYNVDSLYNGVFVFEGLEPGSYTLDASAAGYKPLADSYKAAITVNADETTYPFLFLESESYVPPTVVYTNYPDPVQPSYLGVAKKYEMKQSFINKTVSSLKNMTVRRSIVRGDSIFTLAIDTLNVPHVFLVNPETQVISKELSTKGVQGQILPLSDIAFTADNILIGCNKEINSYDDAHIPAGYKRGTFRVYKWAGLDSVPTEWFSSQMSSNYYAATTGETFAVSGTSNECNIITTAVTTGSSHSIRFAIFGVVDGKYASAMYNGDNISSTSNYTCPKLGDRLRLTTSPRADDQFIIDGERSTPIEFQIGESTKDAPLIGQVPASLLDSISNGVGFFKYAKHALMVAPVSAMVQKMSPALAASFFGNAGVALFDVTAGLDKATLIQTTNTALNPSDFTTTDAGGIVNGADITLFLAKDSTVSKFTTASVAQPVVKRIFAHALTVIPDASDMSYEFSFNANSDAQQAYLVFSDAVSGEKVDSVLVPDVKAGFNKVTIKAADLPGSESQNLKWAVRLIGEPIVTIARVNDNAEGYARATGVAVNNNPESDFFSNIYLDEYNKSDNADRGLFLYDADWNRVNSAPYTGGANKLGTCYRIAIDSNGKVYVPDWSDGNSGIWIADPANLNGDFINLFRNGTRASSGQITNASGVAVGGSSPGLNIVGSGANTVLYCYAEDVPDGNSSNNVVTYNLGSAAGIADSWDVAPNKLYNISAYQANTNGNIIADNRGGVWVAQTRSAGNNVKGVPSLMYVNSDGEVVLNSGVDSIAQYLTGTWGSGFAITPDESTLIINNASSQLAFFHITWNGTTPSLTHLYDFDHSVGDSGNNIYQMAFDFGGNLLTSGGCLGAFSLPTDDNECITPAKSVQIVTKSTTGVSAVNVNTRLAVYPNPTTGMITVNAPEAIKVVNVYSATGALVAHSTEATVDLSSLENGFYFVKVNNLKAVKIIKK